MLTNGGRKFFASHMLINKVPCLLMSEAVSVLQKERTADISVAKNWGFGLGTSPCWA